MSRPNTQYATAHEDQESPALQADQGAGSEAVEQVPAPPPPPPPTSALKREVSNLGEVLIECFRLYEALAQSIIENKGPVMLDTEARALLSRVRVAKARANAVETHTHSLRHPPKRKQGDAS